MTERNVILNEVKDLSDSDIDFSPAAASGREFPSS